MGKITTPLAASGDTFVSPDDTVAESDIAARPSRRLEMIAAVSALILSGTALILSRNIDLRMDTGGLNPRWWPTVLASLASVLSAILIGLSMFGPTIGRGDLESAHSDGWVRMALALALSFLYVLAWSSIGYVVPTIVYLAASLWVFGLRSTKGLIAFPLITTAFIYGLFHFMLRVPL
jgi:hypothetical protein